MALKRLPNDVQSLLYASAQVNNYKGAIEELVYNALDAESTSIAIRINIQQSTIQVIDNGYGITKHDFNVLGQRYMTNKLSDISVIKAASKNYGYRGEFLANIITVSQMVKITSRHEKTEETWAKTFLDGKEKKLAKMSTRPTKGTTVNIKGFLYNLNIQKRLINPLNELQNIKLFLEQLSLVHHSTSLSLRDDSKNEIVFKIHKKRDIYQTLSTLFDIDKTDVLELQVEKNEYKVKALIGKTDKEHDLHWIYLNGKFIHNSSRLHNIINEYFKKTLLIKNQRRLKSKLSNDEHTLFKQNIPFYFTFITCPYIDYEISFTQKQSVIEFKNWEQISKVLEKLVKFYVGDINLKEIKKPENKLINKEQIDIKCNQGTRDQVKKIMDKILGRHSTKIVVTQLQNGVKGKTVKRKIKKRNNKRSDNISKTFLHNDNMIDEVLSKRKHEINSLHNLEKHNNMLDDQLKKGKQGKKIRISKYLNASLSQKNKLEEINMQKKRMISGAKNKLQTKKGHNTSIRDFFLLNQHKVSKEPNLNFELMRDLKESDSTCKKSKIVAQKAEDFLRQHTRENKVNFTEKKYVYKKNNRNVCIPKLNNHAIDDNTLLPQNVNKYIIDKYIMKTKAYKTTYDLVQTILISQQEGTNSHKNNASKEHYCDFSDFYYRRNDTSRCIPRIPKRLTWTHKYMFGEESDTNCLKREISRYTTKVPIQYKTCEKKDNFRQKEISDYMSRFSEESQLCKDIYTKNQSINFRQEEKLYALSEPSAKLTYESHQYYTNEVFVRNKPSNNHSINKKHNMRFITKQSRDNFVTSKDSRTKFKRPTTSTFNNQTKFYDIRMKETIDESYYTIEYSKSNDINNNSNTYIHCDISCNDVKVVKDKQNMKNKINADYENELQDIEPNSHFEKTYIIQPSNFSLGINIVTEYQTQPYFNKTNEHFDTYSIHYSNSEVNNDLTRTTINKDKYAHDENNCNILLVSKSQCLDKDDPLDNNKEPLNVCETILHESGTVEKEFAFSFNENNRLNDSLYNNTENSGTSIEPILKEPCKVITHSDIDFTENVSHHFSSAVNNRQSIVIDNIEGKLRDPMLNLRKFEIIKSSEFIRQEDLPNSYTESNMNFDDIDTNHFNFKNRHRFVPKGMSQIFENCRSKTTCDYNLEKDYYEDSIYNNFANTVQVNSEIYEPIIQNVDELTTNNIHKFQNKVKKDSSSLVFDEKSLKEAKVLGQADCKFIAAILHNRCGKMENATKYLTLFDQHAVHERIRLEKNLADYIYEDKWTSVSLDNITLKMSKDEILYLHNYKDKFTWFGLEWTILNDNEVTVNSIPKAILGKNPREVEKVIKAVKNLIVEEINVMKLQKGCVSLYPKSIMDLVFNEACRYAIKFGDQLSKNDCVELLTALSECKTPFQCAHGRPVMAVLMDIKFDKHEYKINMTKLSQFKQRSIANP